MAWRRNLFWVLSVAVICLNAQRSVAVEPRAMIPLNGGWRFRQGADLNQVERSSYDDSRWTQVDLPHTWNRIGNPGTTRSPSSNDVQGIGWYRLKFKPPTASPDSRYFLQFDAVSAVADVWLNGHYLGKHQGAFARFRFAISGSINTGGENTLVVKADNTRPAPGASTQDVIPLSGDFFMFGGIYREVALIICNPVHVDLMDYGGPGLYSRALKIERDVAEVQVSGRLANDATNAESLLVETRIEDASGGLVASSTRRTALPGANVGQVRMTLRIAHPRLWQGMKDPYLYSTIMTLRSRQGRILDRVAQPLGLRTMRFDADKGFFLNGDHLLLRGVSLHQDRPVIGWATSRTDQRQDFDLLMDMGANAVRLAHYQHDQYSYDLADAHGIVTWAEIPLVNQVSFDGSEPSSGLTSNAHHQLIELIRQNYNHPSIAVWSVGNEIDLTATKTKGGSKAAVLVRSLNSVAKREDPDRLTTMADCCEIGMLPHVHEKLDGIAARDAIVGLTDTVGYNRYFGWYDGSVGDFGAMLDAAHARHPKLPMSVSEYGAGAALTQHSDNPLGGPINPHGRPHPEEFQNYYHELSWDLVRQRPYLWAVFIWNMFDFASDWRNEGDLTDINDKGLVSYDRDVRKDSFFYYRANWSSQPTLHLVGRRHVDQDYGVLDVKAYSNAVQARLWVNDIDQGTTNCTAGTCLWHAIHLATGANTLRTSAEVSGTSISDSLQWTYTGTPAIVRIKAGDIFGYATPDNKRFGSDNFFEGGIGYGVNPPDTKVTDMIQVAAHDPRLYDSFREGEFSYRIPVPNGRYRVELQFTEPSASTSGERVFEVAANGSRVLRDLDIFAAAGGRLVATQRSFEIAALNGYILIEFRPIKGKALVSALSITPIVQP
jgi:beta-galactosidase